MQDNLTINDIAKHAGVGTTTVSRVLNNHPYVAESTRQKVLSAIEALDYRPSFSARHMATSKSHTIGFVSQELITKPFAVQIIKGAHDTVACIGKTLFIIEVGSNTTERRNAINVMLERQVEGIIYATTSHRLVELPDAVSNVPIVFAIVTLLIGHCLRLNLMKNRVGIMPRTSC